MRVQDFMSHDVRTIRPNDTLAAAAQAMWDRDCGALPVVDAEERVVGMLTDRDACMAGLMAGKPLTEIPVERAMSKRLVSCRPDDTVKTAEASMRQHQIRRLPVLDDRSRLVGILSLNDIAIEASGERLRKEREVTAEEVGLTLGAICRHRTPSREVVRPLTA
jgi:CBS domain-containing protein